MLGSGFRRIEEIMEKTMNTGMKASESDKALLFMEVVRSSGNNARGFCKKISEFLNVPDLSEETYGEKWKDCGEHIRPDTFWCMALRGEEKNPFDKFNLLRKKSPSFRWGMNCDVDSINLL